MADEEPSDGDPSRESTDDQRDGDPETVESLREELRDLQRRVDERTVDRAALESDLRKYVRRRVRRGHARGWGPYLVLLYGTAMTLGAFYQLDGGWAIAAMIVVWLSTLGLYALMLVVGVLLETATRAGGLMDRLR